MRLLLSTDSSRAFLAAVTAAALLLSCDAGKNKPAPPADRDERAAVAAQAEPDPAANEVPEVDPNEGYETVLGLAYVELMLGGAQPDDTVPMIVAIHGLGDGPNGFAQLFSSFPEPARLILPRGLDATPSGGWSWFPIRARDGDIEGLARGIRKAADTIAPGVAALAERRPTVGKPVVTGFSQGGMLAFTIAVHHPEVSSAAIPVGGWLPPPLWPSEQAQSGAPRIVALHGTEDNAVAFEPTKEATTHLETLGWAVKLRAYPGVRHVITPEMRRDLHDHLADAIHDAATTATKSKRTGTQ